MSKPKEPAQKGQHDLFRTRLDQVIGMKSPLRVRTQKPRDGKGRHVHAQHAPEVECIGKGKSHKAPWGAACIMADAVRGGSIRPYASPASCLCRRAVRSEGFGGHQHQVLTG